MDDTDRLSKAWSAATSRVPEGWTIDSLRCASASLRTEDRSDDWIAVALGPDGQERQFRAPDPESALDALVDGLSLN